ncbi:MAG: phosphotransferase [Alphaproteobacteria bacterium]|nr:phosphotransferase [Alphaproteobacteria bacterium]
MSKIPFYIGNFVTMFVPDGARRARVRGNINRVLYTPRIKRFIRRTYHVRVKTIRFVRQINLNRVCLVVNDKYYVKLFRNITPERVKNYKKLTDFVAKHISVRIPVVHADNKMAMYVTEKIPGRGINDFDAATILKNEPKIKKQVANIIKEIQAIKIESIPHHENYMHSLQPERATEPKTDTPHPVLAHFDLNETNFLFDDDMNIIGIIDWDMCSVAMNPETDMFVFNRFWNRYKNSPKFK